MVLLQMVPHSPTLQDKDLFLKRSTKKLRENTRHMAAVSSRGGEVLSIYAAEVDQERLQPRRATCYTSNIAQYFFLKLVGQKRSN